MPNLTPDAPPSEFTEVASEIRLLTLPVRVAPYWSDPSMPVLEIANPTEGILNKVSLEVSFEGTGARRVRRLELGFVRAGEVLQLTLPGTGRAEVPDEIRIQGECLEFKLRGLLVAKHSWQTQRDGGVIADDRFEKLVRALNVQADAVEVVSVPEIRALAGAMRRRFATRPSLWTRVKAVFGR